MAEELSNSASPEVEVSEAPRGVRNVFAGRHQPIVLNIKKKGKKKRKYSKSLKDFQIGLRRVTKASDHIADAVAAGIGKFSKRSDKSSSKRRDGMLRDMLENSASAAGTTMRKSSKVPRILAKSLSGRSVRRRLRAARVILGFMR